MYKKTIFLFLSLFVVFVANVFADVVVDVEGKTQKYPDGSTLNVVAAKNLSVEYYGVKFFIPKGEKISLRCLEQNEGNVVFCTSDKFKNIKIGDTTVSADKQTSFSITQDGDLNIDNGTLVSVNEKGKVAILEQGNTYKVAVAVNPKDTFIITDISKYESDSNNEQILKDYVLSPSAPRN